MTRRLAGAGRLAVSAVVFMFFLFRVYEGFGAPSFGDEAGHFVGAVAIHDGDILYRDYIDAHGPLIFFLSWLSGVLLGFAHVWVFRFVPVCAILVALPFLRVPDARSWPEAVAAPTMWLALVGPIWVVQGLFLDDYWTLGGALSAIVLGTYVLPLSTGRPVGRWRAAGAGAAIALLPFAAYAFAPISLLLGLGPLYARWRMPADAVRLGTAIIGAVVASLIVSAWITIDGDWGGLIAFHFVANQRDYSRYVPFGIGALLCSFRPNFGPAAIVANLGNGCFLVGSGLLLLRTRFSPIAFFAIAAILLLVIRGSTGFGDGAFLIAAMALFSWTVVDTWGRSAGPLTVATAICCILAFLASEHATSTPSGQTLAQRRQTPWVLPDEGDDALDVAIRRYAAPGDRILVLPYAPDLYYKAGRLPMRKYHAYLPWEADYARHPWHGHDRDLCVDLPRHPPAVVFFNDWVVWGLYRPEAYMPCVVHDLSTLYVRDPRLPQIFVRKNLAPSDWSAK